MKVLFINTNENYGGASRAAMRIMRGVQRLGVDVQMFVKNGCRNSKNVISIWQYVPTNIFYKSCDWIVQKIKNQWYLQKWRPYKHTKQDVFLSDMRSMSCHGALQKLDYDIINLHWPNQRFLDLRELKKVNKPIVWTLHDCWAFCGLCHVPFQCKKYMSHCGSCPLLGSKIEHDWSYEVFEKKRKIYKDLNLHVVVPSKWLGECAHNSALLSQFPISVIPNGLDTEVFSPQRGEKEKNEKPVILYGAMSAAEDPNKGFISLLAALKIMDSQCIEAKLMVFGANAEEFSMRFEHIDVAFLGYIHDNRKLAAVYSMADVMVVPSFSEVFGQTASEAMACGTPVVAFRCTGIQEVVEDGCGYLAEPYSADDLASGIEWCLNNNENNVLGMAARESVVRRYAMDVVAKQYKQLYESLM